MYICEFTCASHKVWNIFTPRCCEVSAVWFKKKQKKTNSQTGTDRNNIFIKVPKDSHSLQPPSVVTSDNEIFNDTNANFSDNMRRIQKQHGWCRSLSTFIFIQ